MFELTTGTLDRPFRDWRVVPTVFSVMAHLGLLGAGIAAALFVITDELPQVRSMMAFAAEVPAPPPPPPPPPAGPAPRPKSAEVRSAPAPKPGQLVIPLEVPTEIAPESGIYLGEEGGVPGGVEGGIPGGVLGGILGGMMPEAPPPPPPEPARPKPIRIGGNFQPPALIHYVEPIYSDIAVWAKSSGLVILEATVNERGEVTDVKVLRSIKLLDQAAVDAVKQWRYRPVLLNGTPHPFILTVTVSFSIVAKK